MTNDWKVTLDVFMPDPVPLLVLFQDGKIVGKYIIARDVYELYKDNSMLFVELRKMEEAQREAK